MCVCFFNPKAWRQTVNHVTEWLSLSPSNQKHQHDHIWKDIMGCLPTASKKEYIPDTVLLTAEIFHQFKGSLPHKTWRVSYVSCIPGGARFYLSTVSSRKKIQALRSIKKLPKTIQSTTPRNWTHRTHVSRTKKPGYLIALVSHFTDRVRWDSVRFQKFLMGPTTPY